MQLHSNFPSWRERRRGLLELGQAVEVVKFKENTCASPSSPTLSACAETGVFVFCSGKVAKEVVEASSRIQREPPEVHR